MKNAEHWNENLNLIVQKFLIHYRRALTSLNFHLQVYPCLNKLKLAFRKLVAKCLKTLKKHSCAVRKFIFENLKKFCASLNLPKGKFLDSSGVQLRIVTLNSREACAPGLCLWQNAFLKCRLAFLQSREPSHAWKRWLNIFLFR